MAAFQQHKSMQKLECIFYIFIWKLIEAGAKEIPKSRLSPADDALSLSLFSGTCKQSKGLSAGTLQHFVYSTACVVSFSLSALASYLSVYYGARRVCVYCRRFSAPTWAAKSPETTLIHINLARQENIILFDDVTKSEHSALRASPTFSTARGVPRAGLKNRTQPACFSTKLLQFKRRASVAYGNFSTRFWHTQFEKKVINYFEAKTYFCFKKQVNWSVFSAFSTLWCKRVAC